MTIPKTFESHVYDSVFYRYQREGSTRSARGVLPHLIKALQVRSVLDVGCGAAAWLAVHRELGVHDVLGVDGEYVDRNMLLVDHDRFIPQDITKPFDLARQFDLVQCLEVAEHVPNGASGQLLDNLTRHGKCVLFSAAAPGQGGEDHINEQPYGFWRDLFEQRGYALFDCVRPLIIADGNIEPWYRYNLFFFAHCSILDRLPNSILSHRLTASEPVPDCSPLSYRLRKMILRAMPGRAVSALAVMKHRRAVRILANR